MGITKLTLKNARRVINFKTKTVSLHILYLLMILLFLFQ